MTEYLTPENMKIYINHLNNQDIEIEKEIRNLDPKGIKYNDTGWLKYGKDYDDDGLQTYFDEPIINCRFWESKNGNTFYDVILLSECQNKFGNYYYLTDSQKEKVRITINKYELGLILELVKSCEPDEERLINYLSGRVSKLYPGTEVE